jgi:hypothetical protein
MENEMSDGKQVFGTADEKNWLKSLLREGVVTVEFVKKDGSARKMLCTLSESQIPKQFAPKNSGKTQSDEALAVFDIEASGWRSFRYDSITKIQAKV